MLLMNALYEKQRYGRVSTPVVWGDEFKNFDGRGGAILNRSNVGFSGQFRVKTPR